MSIPLPIDEVTEWLEPDGLGGFASGTALGVRTRGYHALLLTATTPPTGRMVLVNGIDAWVEAGERSEVRGERVGGKPEFLSRQRYSPGIVAPQDPATIESFETNPWPTWVYRLRNGAKIEGEIFVPRGLSLVAMRWRLVSAPTPTSLPLRPFLSGRDLHALHHANPVFGFDAAIYGERLRWSPYQGVPAISALSNGAYHAEPEWYRNFLYAEERARGLAFEEDLAAPGIFTWRLDGGPAVLVLGVVGSLPRGSAVETVDRLRRAERARRARLGVHCGALPMHMW
jgi:predicted glycogen debranching enzyme